MLVSCPVVMHCRGGLSEPGSRGVSVLVPGCICISQSVAGMLESCNDAYILKLLNITTSFYICGPPSRRQEGYWRCSTRFPRLINANTPTNQPEAPRGRPSAELSPVKEPVCVGELVWDECYGRGGLIRWML